MCIITTGSKDGSTCHQPGATWTQAANTRTDQQGQRLNVDHWVSAAAPAGSTCWAMPGAITLQSPHVLQQIAGKPALCTSELWGRAPHVGHAFLHTNISIQENKGEKRKFCPYRKGIADRDGERFTLAHSVLSLSFGQCSTLLRIPGFSDLPSRV